MTRITGAQITALCYSVHADNVAAGWWSDITTGQRKERNVGELLMLIVSELCEGAEGLADNLMDDKLPHRQMIEVELADTAIRIFDIGGGKDWDNPATILALIAEIERRGQGDGVVAWRKRPNGNHPLFKDDFTEIEWRVSIKKPALGEGAQPEWFDVQPLYAAPPASAPDPRVVEALRPFADVLAEYDPLDEADFTPGTLVVGSVTNYDLTLEDFRRAAALLAEIEVGR